MRWRLLLVGLIVAVVVAAAPAVAAAKGCRTSGDGPETHVVETEPPTAWKDWIGVFRRPQGEAEVLPIANPSPGLRKFLRRSVRFVGESESGARYFVFLATIRAFRYPERCIREMTPAQQRRIRRQQERARQNSKGVRLGMFAFEGSGGGGSFGARLIDVLTRPFMQTSGNGQGSEAAGIVPDGVASVEMRFIGGHARNVTVTNNFWSTRLPLGAADAFPLASIWRAADGTILKTHRDPNYKPLRRLQLR